jgi:hypothetical protein
MENFYNIIKEAHSGWAYLVLILVFVAFVNSIIGFSSNKAFAAKDRKIALFGLIATHIQLLIAMFLYFSSPYFNTMKQIGMGEVMKNSELRLYLIEHPMMNIIAVILITVGFSKHKTAPTDKAKFKSIWLFYLIAFILILSRIPWNTWLGS